MIEITTTELVLLLWAGVASAAASHYWAQARHRGELLHGASLFIKRIVTDNDLRDELADVIKTAEDIRIQIAKGE